MPRITDIPTCPAIPTSAPSVEQSYDIELITPMFGGGVVTRETDPTFPIRPTSIRGQLQFWWRATVGARYATKEELRAAQTWLWGGVSGDNGRPSRIQVRVHLLKFDSLGACAGFEKDNKDRSRYRSTPVWKAPFANTSLPYALFPFQGELSSDRSSVKVAPASCIHKAQFRLILSWDREVDFASQVEPALRAWVLFGGLGSRTRRGCGSIRCSEFLAKDHNELLAHLKRYLSNTSAKDWPTLADSIFIGRETDKPLEAWSTVIRVLRGFRQAEGIGRNPGSPPKRPGRSRWPEPETIRRVTRQRSSQHSRLENIPDNAFPRAELGLPIVFHFKDEGEPRDTVLYPAPGPEGSRERMASPLILKPLALGNGKFVPLIVRLKTAPLTGVDLREGKLSLNLPNPTLIRGAELAQYPNSPMQGRSPNGSALEAFLAYAKSQGFTQVST